MKREIRVDAGSYCLCFIWFPPLAYGRLQNRRVGARRGMLMGIKNLQKLFYCTVSMETNQLWRSERVECVEDILTRGFR